jgi:hypothetical protein
MRDFKFLQAAEIKPVSDAYKPSERCCAAALNTFRSNIHLTALSITTLPAFIFWTAGEWISACTRAKTQIVGDNASDAVINSQFIKIHNRAQELMAVSMRTTREQQVQRLVGFTTMFEQFAAQAGPYAEVQVEILIKHIAIQSWTAFETLTEDLVMEAVGAYPSLFANVPKDKLVFASKDRIRVAYKVAFPIDNTSILKLTDDSAIDALALIRNLLIHSAGIVDQKFLTEAGKYQTMRKYRGLKIGATFPLDGAIVRSLVDGIVDNGIELVKAVDGWIRAHRPK